MYACFSACSEANAKTLRRVFPPNQVDNNRVVGGQPERPRSIVVVDLYPPGRRIERHAGGYYIGPSPGSTEAASIAPMLLGNLVFARADLMLSEKPLLARKLSFVGFVGFADFSGGACRESLS